MEDYAEIHQIVQSLDPKMQRELISMQAHYLEETNFVDSVQQNERDADDIMKLKHLLLNHFNIEYDAKPSNLSFELYTRVQYYIEKEKPNMYFEFQKSIPFLHKQFGRGAFVCIFSTGTDVLKMKINTKITKSSPVIVNELQNIGNGQFVWYPLKILNRFW
eukprot:67368_1